MEGVRVKRTPGINETWRRHNKRKMSHSQTYIRNVGDANVKIVNP